MTGFQLLGCQQQPNRDTCLIKWPSRTILYSERKLFVEEMGDFKASWGTMQIEEPAQTVK